MMRFLLGALLLLTPSQSVNFFSLKQDIEIGAESAQETGQSLQLVRNVNLNQYLGGQERQSKPVSRRNRAAGCAEPQAAAAEIQFSDREFQGHQLPWISRRRDLSVPWAPGNDGER
jgi:hypothetical protein